MRRITGILVGLLLSTGAPSYGQSGEVGRLHRMINQHRERIGCKAFEWHAEASVIARSRSADMYRRNYFDHETPDGRTFIHELEDAGIEAWGSVAENIALTQAGPASVLELWLDSRPHRRNLESCTYTHQALGETAGYWTQILIAQPKRARRVPEPDVGS